MPLESAKLVEEALRICDGSRSELSRRLGTTGYGEDKIGRWLRSEGGGPRYEDTIKLLEIVGWINTDADRQSAEKAPHDPLADIARGVAGIARAQILIAEALGVQLDEPEQPQGERMPRATHPKRKRKPA